MKKTPVIPTIILHSKLTAFKNEKKIKIKTNQHVFKPQTAKPVGEIGYKIANLLDNYGQTLKTICSHLEASLNRKIRISVLHNWFRGAQPRIGETVIIKALDDLTNRLDKAQTWTSAKEVEKTTSELVKRFGYAKVSEATNTPYSTLAAWSKGLNRVKNSRFEAFKKDIQTKLLS